MNIDRLYKNKKKHKKRLIGIRINVVMTSVRLFFSSDVYTNIDFGWRYSVAVSAFASINEVDTRPGYYTWKDD